MNFLGTKKFELIRGWNYRNFLNSRKHRVQEIRKTRFVDELVNRNTKIVEGEPVMVRLLSRLSSILLELAQTEIQMVVNELTTQIFLLVERIKIQRASRNIN